MRSQRSAKLQCSTRKDAIDGMSWNELKRIKPVECGEMKMTLTTLGLFSKHSLLGPAGWAETTAREIRQATRIAFMVRVVVGLNTILY